MNTVDTYITVKQVFHTQVIHNGGKTFTHFSTVIHSCVHKKIDPYM
jgi:hypothetical protein